LLDKRLRVKVDRERIAKRGWVPIIIETLGRDKRTFDGLSAMRAVLQRVSRARVKVGDEVVGAIERGLLVLVGVAPDDTLAQAQWLADKTVDLRLFPDEQDKMNLSVADVGGGVLVVSQFTLYGDCRKGRRPSFIGAAAPELAVPLYEAFVNAVRGRGVLTATGRFGAMMQVDLVNEGPVTLILETPSGQRLDAQVKDITQEKDV
jgi:D-aminoacyl-tRNA deacylase